MQRVDATKSPTRSRVASLADIATGEPPLGHDGDAVVSGNGGEKLVHGSGGIVSLRAERNSAT